MNLYIAICLLGLTASTTADGLGLGDLGGLVYAPQHASVDYYAYPRYAFEYSVKDPHTGDNKAQWEKRDGDVVKGAYSLVEPDGSLRVVEYHADDKTGFNAVVKRLGPSLHPATVHAAPIYKAPIPVLGGHSSVFSPISVGPVANLGHLASAPLISGPINGGAIHGPALSTQTLIKEPIILKSLAAPILHKPVLHEPIHHAPIYKGPILPEPILNERIIQGPILPELLLNEPIYKNGPIIPGLLKGLPRPIYKAGPIYSEPLGPLTDYRAPLSLYNKHIPLHKEPLPALPLLKSVDLGLFGKGPIGSLDWEGLGRGSLVGGYGLDKGIGSVGPYLEGHGTEQVGLISDGPVGPLKDEGLSQGAVAGGYGLSKGVRSVGQLGLDSLGWARLGGGPVEAGGKEIVRLGPNIDGYQISKEGPFVPLVLEKDRGQWAYNG